MKIKQDFVTNSSSTAYLVGCPTKININQNSIEFDLLRSLSNSFKIMNTQDEIDKFFKDSYGKNWREDEEWAVDHYDKCIEILQGSGSIIYTSIEYGAEVDFPGGAFKKYKPVVIMGD